MRPRYELDLIIQKNHKNKNLKLILGITIKDLIDF